MGDGDLKAWMDYDKEKDKRRAREHRKEYGKVRDAELRTESAKKQKEEKMRLAARQKEISEEKQGVDARLGGAPIGRRRILA